jgi:hypothetical protein
MTEPDARRHVSGEGFRDTTRQRLLMCSMSDSWLAALAALAAREVPALE